MHHFLLSLFFYCFLFLSCMAQNEISSTSDNTCSSKCNFGFVCQYGKCVQRSGNINNNSQNSNANQPPNTSQNGTIVSGDLICVTSTYTQTLEKPSGTACYGLQTCSDKGVCSLCLKPCVGESFTECDSNDIPHFETAESSCQDTLDNDCDGFYDCKDSNCANDNACLFPNCINMQNQSITFETEETLCNDNQDNDCDGKTDCLDESCMNQPACCQNIDTTVSISSWFRHDGDEGILSNFTKKHEGYADPALYPLATIPNRDNPNWRNVGDSPAWGKPHGSDSSSSLPDCKLSVDFTYFQTFVNITGYVPLKHFNITIDKIDDGSGFVVFNDTYPEGKFIEESYCDMFITPFTSNLAPYLVLGENRVVMIHIDNCCCGKYMSIFTLDYATGSPCE